MNEHTHIMPVDDDREHVEDVMCTCMPSVKGAVVQHNSYDGREIGAVARTVLDMLATALVDEGHEWTDDEREEYERAISVLNAHYPPREGESALIVRW